MAMRILAALFLFGICVCPASGQVQDDGRDITITINSGSGDTDFQRFVQNKEGTLFYDSATGEMFIDAVWPNSETFKGYALWSEKDQFLTENYLRLGGSPDLFFLQPKGITEAAAFSGGFENGLYQLGAVYPANVGEEEFLADVRTQWGNDLHYGFNIEFGKPSGVPLNDPDLPKLNDAWAKAATLSYIAPTGELILDTGGVQGGFVTVFGVRTSDGINVDDAINPKPGNRFDVRPNSVSGTGLLPPGEYNLGALLTPNLSATELDLAISSSRFSGAAAVGSTDIDLLNSGGGQPQMSLVYVPEPSASTSVFLALLLLGMMCRRRGG